MRLMLAHLCPPSAEPVVSFGLHGARAGRAVTSTAIAQPPRRFSFLRVPVPVIVTALPGPGDRGQGRIPRSRCRPLWALWRHSGIRPSLSPNGPALRGRFVFGAGLCATFAAAGGPREVTAQSPVGRRAERPGGARGGQQGLGSPPGSAGSPAPAHARSSSRSSGLRHLGVYDCLPGRNSVPWVGLLTRHQNLILEGMSALRC